MRTEWKQFDARLDVRPPLGEETLKKIPARRGVVLLLAEDDEPVVMLTAADMRARTRTRLAEPPEEDDDKPSRRADLREIVRAVWYRECPSHFEADLWFLEHAVELWPKRLARMIGWKPPWFVTLDLEDPYPHFSRTRAVPEAPWAMGPFPTGKDAETFIESLQDAFDLCRSVSCLRRAPDGPRCAYAEMGRCVGPADGTISMDEYRRHLRAAMRFAAGDRAPRREELHRRMQEAGKALRFEEAAAWKSRLDRMEFFESDACRQADLFENFSFLFFQPGATRQETRCFALHQGAVQYVGPLAYPPEEQQLAGAIATLDWLRTTDTPTGTPAALRMGLAARTLFQDAARRGVVVRRRESLTPVELAECIERHAETLRLRPPRRRHEDPSDVPSTALPSQPPDDVSPERNDTRSGPGESV